MQRRKFLIGAGSAAVGASALVGSGAYSAMTAERSADINVVTDANGLLGLQVGDWADGRVYEENGELGISFNANTDFGDGDGVNVNSVYQVGSLKYSGLEDTEEFPGDSVPDIAPDKGGTSPSSNSAFDIVNQDTESKEVTIGWEFDEPETLDGSLLGFGSRADENQGDGTVSGSAEWDAMVAGSDNQNPSMSYTGDAGINTGAKIGVSILVDTREGSPDEDLSGTLIINSD